MANGSQKRKKKKNMQTDPFMDKINVKLNKYIVLFYFAGTVVYLIWELIKAKNKA